MSKAKHQQPSRCEWLPTPQAGIENLPPGKASDPGCAAVRKRRFVNGVPWAFRSRALRAACTQHGIAQKFTRAYRPQTNGKAKRCIQSALREWACGWSCQNSAQGTQALLSWQHHHNWRRPRHGIDRLPPMRRLPSLRNKLLIFHT